MEQYWLQKLEKARTPEWPYTLPGTPPALTTLTLPVSQETMDAMRAIAGANDLNILKLLIGGLGILLWKYTGQQDVLIALPPLSLPDTDASRSGTLYCLLDLHPALPVKELLQQVHSTLNEAHLHSEYDRTQLKTLFSEINQGDVAPLHSIGLSLPDITMDGDWLDEHQLHIEFISAGQQIRITARHLPLPKEMLYNLAESALHIASSFSANKDKTIAQVAIAPPSALQLWRATFQKRTREYPTGLTVVDLFLQQASLYPTRTALVFEEECLSYADLDQWSGAIAGYIATHRHTDAPLFIGLMIPRSPAMVAAVLGILRAGGAYVPIDPNYPADRIRQIAIDTQCPLILTATDNKEEIPGMPGNCRFVDISEIPDRHISSIDIVNNPATIIPTSSPDHFATPDGVAYVIYSSGTTGKPKGIMIQHKAILNLLYWYNERYQLHPGTRIVQLTNIVVDIAFQEICSALINGLTLYIPGLEVQQDKQGFLQWLDTHQITFIQLIPDMLSTYFIDTPRIASLEWMLCGGDKLNEGLKDKIVEKGYRLFNIYGQTETAIDTVGAECRYNEPMCFNDYVPNYAVFILDEYGQLCPPYVAGEICTAGAGLALGYLGDLSATAGRFIPHPFEAGQRIYRTGDRARRMPDGSIRLLGREDQQVKVSGYRIELEEVEGVLLRCPGIGAAAVIAKEADNGEKQLLAFLVSEEDLKIQECTAYVRERLPAYMVPAYFLQVEKLPLTAIGKVDRKALAAYEGIPLFSSGGYLAPRNPVEEELVSVWEEVLGRSGIGVKDNFFDIGGHSLKVTRLVSRIRKGWGVVIDLKDIFVHPVLEDQATLIAKGRQKAHTSIPHLPDRSDGYVLSSSQHRLWMLCQAEESNAAYNMPGVIVFEGVLDRKALDEAFRQVIRRHEILRTVFRADDSGNVRQYVLDGDASGFSIVYHDLPAGDPSTHGPRNPSTQDAILTSSISADLQRGFDLSTGPLLRASIYSLSETRWVFSYVMHHIISDDWSMGVFFNDLLRAYNNSISDEQLRIQYRDYAAWQRNQLSEADRDRNYWLDQFAGQLPVLELPLDKTRPAIKTYKGGMIRHSFSPERTRQLQTMLNQEGCTLFMGLVSIVDLLLHRYTGQEDIIIGSPVAGREHSDLEQQIGYYVNMLALRSRFNGTDSFRDLLQQTKDNTLGAYAHQSYPFDALVGDLALPYNPGRNALFDVVVGLQNAGDEELRTSLPADLRISPYGPVTHVSSKFDLIFNFHRSDGNLHVAIEYSSDLFEEATILRMTAHLDNLLEAALNTPDNPLIHLPYLQEAEQQLLRTGNTIADATYPMEETVISLFETQVRRTPDHIALVSGNTRMSYKELNALANQLGRYLRKHYDLEPEALIGLLLERSEWMIIAILGILKAGGAYVPIDPQYPQDRIDFMLEDSGCRVLIDAAGLERFIAEAHLYSTADAPLISPPSALAYVIYTSGTTGRPKGTLICHYQVVRLFMTDSPLFDFNNQDVWTMFHSYCFDFSVWEMYGALLFGGRLVIVPRMVAKDPGAFLQLLDQEQVTVLNQTPSSFYNLSRADEDRDSTGTTIRYIIFGGEALSPGRLRHWRDRYPQTRLINMYGITETTVHVTCKEIGETEIDNNISNIGRPIPTLRTYVLDAHQQLLPVGVWGELYVGGAGVARGYLNREALTRERFIPNPFNAGDRLYRSGDRVRMLPNGEMEYDGRLDEQVKIRGYRIELGEIQSALEDHDGIDQALVIARTTPGGTKELLAYIVADQVSQVNDLRTWLASRLPDYMLPAHFIPLQQLPLTANGKIDRKQLPLPDTHSGEKATGDLPQDDMQQLLLDIWQQVLGLKGIGIHDNFFSIGGNSISMIEVIAKARARQIGITIRQLFECPTIALLSRVAVRQVTHTADQGPVTGTMPLLPIQISFFESLHPAPHHFNYGTILAAPPILDKPTLLAMTTALVSKHDALRLRFPQSHAHSQSDDRPQASGPAWHDPLTPQLIEAMATVIDCTHLGPGERITWVSHHAAGIQESLSLSDGPLCQMVWYDYGREQEGRLLIVVHHLIVDGVSWRLLLSEIDRLFTRHRRQQSLDLGAKTSAYKLWSEKLQQYAHSPALLSEREYWYSVLKAAPAGETNPHRTMADQQQLVVEWDEAYTSKLVFQSLKAYTTQVRDILLTALLLAMRRWGMEGNILLHQEGHGREDIIEGIDLSQTVGWFTSIYPVLLKQTDQPNEIGKTIKYVKENLRAIPSNGIGYGVLRYLTHDETIIRLEQTHPAALLFNYLGEFNQSPGRLDPGQIKERTGANISPQHKISYSLEFNGAILDKRLRFGIGYIPDEHPDIARLADNFKMALEQVIDHCAQAVRTHFTPTDFPLASLGQSRIEELEAEFPDLLELYPATPMQQAMYFHSFVADDEGAYIVQQHGHLRNIDPELLAASWRLLIERHSILRTAFTLCEQNGLLQVVSSQAELPYTYIDCRHLHQEAWEEKIAAIVESDANIPFDFERAPLLRYTLLQQDTHNWYILLSLHHIILDGWSMPILYGELSRIYQQLSRQEPVSLPPVPDYGKYVHWLLTQDQDKAMAFWQDRFPAVEEITQLALLDKAAPALPVPGYRELATLLTMEESEELKGIAARHQVTLHTLLVAAWARLLCRYTDTDQAIFGMTISGRSEAFEGIGNMVGLFINSIPIRVAYKAGQPVAEWLSDIHHAQMEYNQYGLLGLNTIRRLNHFDRDTPMFESLLVHQNYPDLPTGQGEREEAKLEFSNAGFKDENNYPLTLMVFSRRQLSFSIIYKTDVFDHQLMEELAAHFKEQLIRIGDENALINIYDQEQDETTNHRPSFFRG